MANVTGDVKNLGQGDLSIMPSLRCNLACTFCMYDCGPKNTLTLDLGKVEQVLSICEEYMR